MSGVIDSQGTSWTAVDLVQRFGAIPLARVRSDPAPGTATEADVVRIHGSEDRLYELFERTLVEKTVGTYESYLAGVLVRILGTFVVERDLGIVLPPDGMLRLAPGLVRIPDVSYVSWDHLPGRVIPDQAIADLVPDLAVEVISPGNTHQEMERKLQEYFDAGVRLVWYVYPRLQEIRVYTSIDEVEVVAKDASLGGGDVLHGISVPLSEFFRKHS